MIWFVIWTFEVFTDQLELHPGGPWLLISGPLIFSCLRWILFSGFKVVISTPIIPSIPGFCFKFPSPYISEGLYVSLQLQIQKEPSEVHCAKITFSRRRPLSIIRIMNCFPMLSGPQMEKQMLASGEVRLYLRCLGERKDE